MQQGKYHKFEPVKRFDEYSKKYSNDLLIKALIAVSYTHLDVYKRQP